MYYNWENYLSVTGGYQHAVPLPRSDHTIKLSLSLSLFEPGEVFFSLFSPGVVFSVLSNKYARLECFKHLQLQARILYCRRVFLDTLWMRWLAILGNKALESRLYAYLASPSLTVKREFKARNCIRSASSIINNEPVGSRLSRNYACCINLSKFNDIINKWQQWAAAVSFHILIFFIVLTNRYENYIFMTTFYWVNTH